MIRVGARVRLVYVGGLGSDWSPRTYTVQRTENGELGIDCECMDANGNIKPMIPFCELGKFERVFNVRTGKWYKWNPEKGQMEEGRD